MPTQNPLQNNTLFRRFDRGNIPWGDYVLFRKPYGTIPSPPSTAPEGSYMEWNEFLGRYILLEKTGRPFLKGDREQLKKQAAAIRKMLSKMEKFENAPRSNSTRKSSRRSNNRTRSNNK